MLGGVPRGAVRPSVPMRNALHKLVTEGAQVANALVAPPPPVGDCGELLHGLDQPCAQQRHQHQVDAVKAPVHPAITTPDDSVLVAEDSPIAESLSK